MNKSNKNSNSKNYRKKQNRNRSHRSGPSEHRDLAERASDLAISSSGSDTSSQSEDEDQNHGSPPKFKIAMWGMYIYNTTRTVDSYVNANLILLSFIRFESMRSKEMFRQKVGKVWTHRQSKIRTTFSWSCIISGRYTLC